MRRHILPGLVALLALEAQIAGAHTVGVSRGEYRVSGAILQAELTFARPELAAAFPELDADRDGSLSADEVERGQRTLDAGIVGRLEVRAPLGPCGGALEAASLTEQDGVAVAAAYRCPSAGDPLSIRLGFLESLSLGHRHLASVAGTDGVAQRMVAYEARPELHVAGSSGAGAAAASVAWPLLRLGIHHILTGYDHLLFLFGLILVGGRLRPLLVVVTAFTAGHSVTLALAALGVWAPSPRLVEPAIALSIAYVGVENWFVRDADRRWLITLPFGLIHGFGFAGALQEVSLPSGQIPLALAAFNVGVETGQVAVLLIMLPAVLWLGRRRWFAAAGVRAVSAGIALAGLVWFVERLAR